MRDCDDNDLLHDHLTALAAASIGETRCLPEALVDTYSTAPTVLAPSRIYVRGRSGRWA